MPEKWSKKEERQYEHIRRSQRERGVSAGRAQEIAARTVNKERRESGQTPNKRSQGTGNPNRPLPDRSKSELYNRARQLGVSGRSKMTKSDLVRAIRKAA